MTTRWMEKDERPGWLVRAGASIEHGEKLVGIMETERFAVVKMPGHSYWSGIGMRSYGATSYTLIEKGQSVIRGRELHEGRAKKRDLGRMYHELAEAEREKSKEQIAKLTGKDRP